MKVLKKSFNLSADLAQRLDDFVAANPGLSLTMIMTQSLEHWLKNPKVSISLPKAHTQEDIDNVISNNSDLMDDLSK